LLAISYQRSAVGHLAEVTKHAWGVRTMVQTRGACGTWLIASR
jgi:hypothetical protein